MVKPETRQYRWQVQSLAHFSLAIPPMPCCGQPKHPGHARFYTCALEVLPAPKEFIPGASSCHKQAAGHIAPFGAKH